MLQKSHRLLATQPAAALPVLRRALMSLRPSLVVPARYKIFARRRGTRICFTREEFTFDR